MKKHLFLFLLLALSCGEVPESSSVRQTTDSVVVRTIPDTPLDVALKFSNSLGMNDPACFDFLSPALRDSVVESDLSPWQIFGRWRGFDSNGRLTESVVGEDSLYRTSYYCTVVRLEELPPVTRLDFVLEDGQWLISGIESRLPGSVLDSLSVEAQASLVLQNPALLREMRIARMLFDDCALDHRINWASCESAVAGGADFADYIMELSPESYSVLALSNTRVAAKLQIIQERATYQVTGVPVELRDLLAAWRELAYLKKAVLRARHEAMQNLRQTGTLIQPDVEEEESRIAFLEQVFYSVDNTVERDDTVSGVYPALLTSGNSEPLEKLLILLDPHQLEQKLVDDLEIPIWRALGVDMNGDVDPERVVYWAGDLYLFLGTPTGYRLVWRSWKDYESDFHPEFATQRSPTGNRSVVLVGNSGSREYELSLGADGVPVLDVSELFSDSTGSDENVESPLLRGEHQ